MVGETRLGVAPLIVEVDLAKGDWRGENDIVSRYYRYRLRTCYVIVNMLLHTRALSANKHANIGNTRSSHCRR